MNKKSEKIDSVISEKRIKLHHFLPSDRKIWTVVGKEKEHWLDPDLEFCSCSGFYFGMLKNKNHNPIKGPITLICSNFSLSKLRNVLSGFIKSIKQITSDIIPPK